MSLIRKHVAVLQAWACLALVNIGQQNIIMIYRKKLSLNSMSP